MTHFNISFRSLLFGGILLSVLSVVSCSTPRYTTQLVEHVHQDTVYLSNIHYDSIYILQERSSEYHPNSQSRIAYQSSLITPDTLFIKDRSIEYRYKLLKDTIYKTQVDSVPYQVTITEVKELKRPLTFFDYLTRTIFWLLLVAFTCWLYIKTSKFMKKFVVNFW